MTGIKIPGTVVLLAYFAVFLDDGMITKEFHLSVVPDWNSYHPCMKFHSSLVAFVDGKGQRIIAGIPSCATGQGFGKSFDRRRIDQVSTEAGLKHHGVEIGFFQLVEYVA